MKTEYPYFTAVKVYGGILERINKTKKYTTCEECVEYLYKWAMVHQNSFNSSQFAIVKYTDMYDGKIIIIFNKTKRIDII